MAREIELLKQERKNVEESCKDKEEDLKCELVKKQGAAFTKFMIKRKTEVQNIK